MRVRYRDRAREDLVAIARYVARASGSAEMARRLTIRLRTKCRDLAQLPGTQGRARLELGPDIRSYAMDSYVIFFRYVERTFEVVTIIEGHRDIDALFVKLH